MEVLFSDLGNFAIPCREVGKRDDAKHRNRGFGRAMFRVDAGDDIVPKIILIAATTSGDYARTSITILQQCWYTSMLSDGLYCY